MRILNWVQNKLINGRQDPQKTNRKPTAPNQSAPRGSQREEFSDWPNAILTIGTFGYNKTSAAAKENIPPVSTPCLQITPEELGELQSELSAVLLSDDHHPQSSSVVIRPNHPAMWSDGINEEEAEERHPAVAKFVNIHPASAGNGEVCLEEKKRYSIEKKSLFLLKKMFACRSGFVPAIPATLKPAPAAVSNPVETRMAKILRAILHKKIYPQGPQQTAGPILIKKKYLDTRQHVPITHEDDDHDVIFQDYNSDDDERCKWVKTDTEYIVLEI